MQCARVLFAFIVLGCGTAWGERPYDEGPLRGSEFRATPPTKHPYKALTSTKLTYSYRYRSVYRPGRATAKLTELKLTNEFEADKSWNRRPDDANLLRHEQGHFDITEAMRVRAAAFWKARIGRVTVTGTSEKDAVGKLEALVKKEMQPFFQRNQLLQKEYDRQTKHGQLEAQQQQWQKILAAAIRDPKAPLPVVTQPADPLAPSK